MDGKQFLRALYRKLTALHEQGRVITTTTMEYVERDDGLEGDEKAGDGIWSLRTVVPAGTEVQYKYTNSGQAGEWIPGEEFPVRHRSFTVPSASPALRTIRDIFGR
jgi:hypothetical protein